MFKQVEPLAEGLQMFSGSFHHWSLGPVSGALQEAYSVTAGKSHRQAIPSASFKGETLQMSKC